MFVFRVLMTRMRSGMFSASRKRSPIETQAPSPLPSKRPEIPLEFYNEKAAREEEASVSKVTFGIPFSNLPALS